MNEAETRTELIVPVPKAAGRGILVPARSRHRETISPMGQQRASKPSGPIHGLGFIGDPTRNIPCLIEDIGDDRRRAGVPGEPVSMQLDPPKPISRQRRIGPRVGQPGMRIGRDPRQCDIICLDQSPGRVGPGGPMRRGPKSAPDHAQILRLGGVRDQDRHRRSFRRCVRLTLGTGLLKRLKHTTSLALHGAGVTNTPRRQVKHAGIQCGGQCPWRPPAGPLVHVPPHRYDLTSSSYHIQGPVRNNGFVRPAGQRPRHPSHCRKFHA